MSFITLTLAHPVAKVDEDRLEPFVEPNGRYGLQMDFASVADLVEAHGLVATADETVAAY